LIKLAESDPLIKSDANQEVDESANNQNFDLVRETSNQQYIIKQIIKSQRFRNLVLMKKQHQERKLNIIKTYAKKRE
jgi:hypothetical protein